MSTPEQQVQALVSPQTLPDPGDPLGIDLLLAGNGDLVLTGSGGFAIAASGENAIQALTLRMLSSPGDLPLWPEYGSAFNEEAVGQIDNPTLVLGLATAELTQLIQTDRRFLGIGNVNVIPTPTPRGLSYSVTCELYLATGSTIAVSNLSEPRGSTIVDPTFTDVQPLATDSLDYTTIDQAEYDTLADLDQQQAMLNDLN